MPGGRRIVALLLLLLPLAVLPVEAYGVLTHEEIIDLAWKEHLVGRLRKRFPRATEEDLRRARAYAYGGCVMQDMGYYPLGSAYFSDLVHYVRSGDFVVALLRESSDLDEYAFALGALAHYTSDNRGHPIVNRAVALGFPKLRARYGDEVTYAEAPVAHIRTEVGFDMVQIAKGRYAPDDLHDAIGFAVATSLLERAFASTYGFALEEALGDVERAVGSYRWSVSRVIPELTRVALYSGRVEAVADTPNEARRKFRDYVSRADYEKEWGTHYRRPGFLGKLLAFVLRVFPKVGPLQRMRIAMPSRETEDMYVESLNQTLESYVDHLGDVSAPDFRLANRDCDTGADARFGEYERADQTHARLLHTLMQRRFAGMTPDRQRALLGFFADHDAPSVLKKSAKRWRRTMREIEALRGWKR